MSLKVFFLNKFCNNYVLFKGELLTFIPLIGKSTTVVNNCRRVVYNKLFQPNLI